jgi:hypothetical protein
MPLVAQVSGAVALTALLMGPWWSRVTTPAPASNPPATSPAPSVNVAATTAPVAPLMPERPAHLNLDLRHSFETVALLVTVDGERVLETRLEGSGKKFKMFGKRAARGFTRTLDLRPGVRIVRVRVRSTAERFDQTRVERFELGSAQVASWRITADETGLTAAADKPTAPPATITPTPAIAPVQAPAVTAAVTSVPGAAAAPASAATQQQADALADLLNMLRSMLIGIAGFVATTSAGFVLEQYLSAKKRIYVEGRRSASGDVISTP